MTYPSTESNDLTARTLRQGIRFTACAMLLLASAGRGSWAISYLMGATLSLFSLYSLAYPVRRLLHPEAPQAATMLLAVLLLLKLPFYALCLYFAMRLPGFSPFALLAGAALVPMTLAFYALRDVRAHTARKTLAPTTEPIKTEVKLQSAVLAVRTAHAELTQERG